MKTIELTEEQVKVLKEVVGIVHEEQMTMSDTLFIKGEYIKADKYADRANLLEQIYIELNK